MDRLLEEYPSTTLSASGQDVGLPPGQMGNSEVGHLNIGAGRLVLQDLQRINHSITDGGFFRNGVLLDAIRHAGRTGGTLHLMGLLSDGGVHSHIDHLFSLLEMSKGEKVNRVCVHAFLDGRDVPPRSASRYVRMLEDFSGEIEIGSIQTIMGRYYAMDRDNRWERTKLAYDAIARSEGLRADSAEETVQRSYEDGVDDEFLVPRVIGSPAPMSDKDAVILFNFRPDRPRQLTRALIDKDFKGFDRGNAPPFPFLVTMTEYDDQFGVPFAFAPQEVREVLADVLYEN
jgi:2,3-bisphosphoglycerate-independent phosphoglycerate mutase